MITFKFNKLGLSYNNYVWQPNATVFEIEIPNINNEVFEFQISNIQSINSNFENCYIDWGDDGYYDYKQGNDAIISGLVPIDKSTMSHYYNTYNYYYPNDDQAFSKKSKIRYIVKLIGDIAYFKVATKNCVVTLYQLSDTLKNCTEMFKDQGNLTVINTDARIPKDTVNAYDMFKNCTSLPAIPEYFFYNWILPSSIIQQNKEDLSGLINENSILSGLITNPDIFESQLQQILLVKLENISGMFENCETLQYLHNSFKLPDSVTNLNNMFKGCTSLKKLGNVFQLPEKISGELLNFCSGCNSLQYLPSTLSFENVTGSVSSCFEDCYSLSSVPGRFPT